MYSLPILRSCNRALKGASHLVDVMTDPQTKLSEEPKHGALQHSLGTELGLFEYLNQPENELERKMFAKRMQGAVSTQPASSVLEGE